MSSNRASLRTYAVVAALALVLPMAFGVSDSGAATRATRSSSSTPYVDAFIGDLTGTTAGFGVPILDGAKVAAAQLNAKGGILGHKVEVKAYNDANSDPTGAIIDVKQAEAAGTVNQIYPGLLTADGEAMLPSINQHKILAISSLAASGLDDPTKNPTLYFMAAQSKQNYPPFVAVAKKKGWKKVAILYTDDASEQAEFAAYKDGLEKAGINVVGASFSTTALDVTPQLVSLRSQNPDALLISSLGAQTLYIFRDRGQIGWTNTPTYGDEGTSSTPLEGSLPAADLKNVFVFTQTHNLNGQQQLMGPTMAKFITQMKAMGFQSALTNVGAATSALGYDALELANAAANQAHSIDTTKMVDALNHLKQPKAPLPWVYFGSDNQLGCYCFTTKSHVAPITSKYYVYTAPGKENSDGYYQPIS